MGCEQTYADTLAEHLARPKDFDRFAKKRKAFITKKRKFENTKKELGRSLTLGKIKFRDFRHIIDLKKFLAPQIAL
jgi:hypothetical protein